MVDTVIDPIRMPTITLSQAEMDEIEAQMAVGALPADFLERYDAAVESNVFGHDHRKDKHGNPIEQGRGSAGNQTQQSVDAYIKFGRPAPGASDAEVKEFDDNLKRMRAELEACSEARAAAGTVRRKRGSRR
jgi:hypothetical protein